MRRERHSGKAVLLGSLFLLLLAVASLPGNAWGNDRQEASQLVDKARLTFESFMDDRNMGAYGDLLKTARAVFIVPQLLKGAFIVGASGGSGVVLVRGDKGAEWGGPAFYTLGGASFGLQIGGQASEVILLAMTERGVSALLSSSFKLGADVGVAAGPVGAGVAASTANLSADILSFARSKGLYGGISLDGAVVATREGLNHVYYGKTATTADILIRRSVTNQEAHRLREAVARAAR